MDDQFQPYYKIRCLRGHSKRVQYHYNVSKTGNWPIDRVNQLKKKQSMAKTRGKRNVSLSNTGKN